MNIELIEVLATLVAVVVPLIIIATVWIVPRERLQTVRIDYRSRTVAIVPFILILGGVLAFNARFRSIAHDISWWLGFEITHIIVRIEGDTVARFQEVIGGDTILFYFSFMYVYGYVFLLVFPLVAYFFLDDLSVFKGLTVAYTLNYAIGFILYTLFVAFGPRNIIPELIGQSMHTFYPQLQLLSSAVNEYTNVFPSLHTSLSATVMLFAWYTRDLYDRWMPIAMFIGASIIVSTMYLAIHWIVDVMAGIALASVTYWIAVSAIENGWFESETFGRVWSRVVGSGE